MAAAIYKICRVDDWQACQREGRLPLSPVDRADGFVHLSAAHQVQQTAAKHFAGQAELVVLAVDPDRLPAGSLRWEVSRGGDRFPHLYGALTPEAVVGVTPAPLGDDGVPQVTLP
ncbi:MAG: DUF952 domain-containing protein [Myxococcales bacterium]|nr:DUF952 domain-containing protein [Myxococcales bacterium]